MAEISRRHFVAAVGACAACAVAGEAFAQPRGRGGPPPRKPSGPVVIGTKADYAADGVFDKFSRTGGFFVIRHDKKLYAVSNVCTHKLAVMNKEGDAIVCPKHASKFSVEGTPTEGPAKVSLARFSIKAADDGKISVDPATSFEERDWEKPEAFLALE